MGALLVSSRSRSLYPGFLLHLVGTAYLLFKFLWALFLAPRTAWLRAPLFGRRGRGGWAFGGTSGLLGYFILYGIFLILGAGALKSYIFCINCSNLYSFFRCFFGQSGIFAFLFWCIQANWRFLEIRMKKSAAPLLEALLNFQGGTFLGYLENCNDLWSGVAFLHCKLAERWGWVGRAGRNIQVGWGLSFDSGLVILGSYSQGKFLFLHRF